MLLGATMFTRGTGAFWEMTMKAKELNNTSGLLGRAGALTAVIALTLVMGGCPGGSFDPNSIGTPPSGYSLSVRAVGGGTAVVVGGDAPNADGYYNEGAQVVIQATADTDAGFRFKGWEGDAGGDETTITVVMNSDKLVYAIFSAMYELNVGVIGQGTAAPAHGEYMDGDVVTLVADPATGWEFVRWEGSGVNGETTPTVELTMDGNKDITAIFDPIGPAYTLTVNIQGNGGVAPLGGTYPEGEQVTLVATPASGWGFLRWDGDSLSLISSITLTMDRNKTVTAVFTPLLDRYELTLTTEGQGTVTADPDPNGNIYVEGTQVQLDPNPASGWRFDRWEIDLTGNADPATITMNSDMSIRAVFVSLNAAPVANGQQVSTAQNTPANITLTGTDAEDDPLTFQITAQPENGTLDITDLPAVTYTPNAGYTGTDDFEFTVNDGTSTSAPATVTITVGAASAFDFYAVYDELIKQEDIGDDYDAIAFNAFSGDGTKIVFANGRSTDHRRAYLINADGTGLQTFNLPDADPQLTAAAISRDGSRAFIAQRGSLMTKIEGGTATTVDFAHEAGMYDQIYCTADGEWVYWCNDWDSRSVWKVSHDGAVIANVFSHTDVVYDNGHGAYRVGPIAVSDDGATIAFIPPGYWDGAFRDRDEIFVWKNGTITQLTTDGATRGKSYITLSGDGTTIAFRSWGDGGDFIEVMGVNGENRRQVAPSGYNFNGLSITHDGSKLFYSDVTSSGRLVNTDGSGSREVLGLIGARTVIQLSDDGTRVMFKHEYHSWPFLFSLYVGYFNEPNAVADAPVIEQIAMDPPKMPRGDAEARVKLTARVTDPDGPADLKQVDRDDLLDGVKVGDELANYPIYFSWLLNDGTHADVVANDDVWTSEGSPGNKIDELTRQTARILARDQSDTVVVADITVEVE